MARRQYQNIPNHTKPDATDLSAEQTQALGLLLAGETDERAAQAVGVSRQTVWEWRSRNPEFMAELNRQRDTIWTAQADRLRGMIGKAIDVLAGDLDSDDPKARRDAAVHLLKCVGIYGADLTPAGETDPGAIRQNQLFDSFRGV